MSVERIGVSSVEKIINQMGMIFREQPVDDYGIDAQIEIVENKCATGKLIAVQIKSGNSYFKELTPNSIIYRGKRKHYDYWCRWFGSDNGIYSGWKYCNEYVL